MQVIRVAMLFKYAVSFLVWLGVCYIYFKKYRLLTFLNCHSIYLFSSVSFFTIITAVSHTEPFL